MSATSSVSRPSSGPNAAEEGPLSAVTADRKGVPPACQALPPEEETDPPRRPWRTRAMARAKKANKKKTAAVGGCIRSSRLSNGRRCDRGSDGSKARKLPPQPAEQFGLRAESLVGKAALFLWLADEVIRRNRGNKPVIFLSDGERLRSSSSERVFT